MYKNIFLLLLIVLITSCDKDENTPQTLPEATQTGRGIFACYVDGKPFIDNSGSPNSNNFNCFYQFVEGEYYFGISAFDTSIMPQNIFIGSYKKQIFQSETYSLLEANDGNLGAGGGFSISQSNYQVSNTSINNSGQLTINKLDFTSRIVSGTFSFDILHPVTGELIQIRDGRFDTHFGQ